MLALASLILVLAVAAARGCLIRGDCIIPIALLSLGHFVNLLAQFQIVFVLTTVPGCLVLASLALLGHRSSRTVSAGLAVGLAALPLTGTAGLVQALPVAVWLTIGGLFHWIGGSRRDRGLYAAMAAGGSLGLVITLFTCNFLVRPTVHLNLTDLGELG